MSRQDAKDARRVRNEPGAEVDGLATTVIEAAVEVHCALGPGLLEAVYERALGVELTIRGVPFVRQPSVVVRYKGQVVGDARPDLLVAERLIVELKAIDCLGSSHLAQAMAYLAATRLPLALLINFNVPVLLRGVRRVVRSADQPSSASPWRPWRPGG